MRLRKMHNITNLSTTTALPATENKIPDHSKYINTPKFTKLTADILLRDQYKQIQQAKMILLIL